MRALKAFSCDLGFRRWVLSGSSHTDSYIPQLHSMMVS